jgi:hypothetical protein
MQIKRLKYAIFNAHQLSIYISPCKDWITMIICFDGYEGQPRGPPISMTMREKV